MKKRFANQNITGNIPVCILLLCAVLGCTACSTNAGETSDSDTTKNSAESGSQQSDDDPQDETEGNIDQDSGIDADTGASESDIIVSNTASNIKIEMQEEKDNKSTEDGIVYFYKSYSYPIVSIEGNMDAAEKINADIRSRIDSFNATSEVEGWAEEMIHDFEAGDSDYQPIGYSEGLTFHTIRSDSNVISFSITYDSYSGGAHGNTDTLGVNYNAKTGDLLTFSDLSDDPAAFREDTLAYNQKLAETDSYQERMFSSDDITNGTLESVLYADDAWYLSPSGLVFLSNPYALGPYAAGLIEFIIPYADLAEMGFKESYTYQDRFVLKLQNNETYDFDLNGDGSEDSILIYSEYVEGSDGIYNTVPHLIINDTDFANDGDEAIQEQLTQLFNSWAQPALFDLNTDDNYVELMVVSGEYENDEYVYYSHFYRYTDDGSLIYLGKTRGDANDPTVEIDVLTSDI